MIKKSLIVIFAFLAVFLSYKYLQNEGIIARKLNMDIKHVSFAEQKIPKLPARIDSINITKSGLVQKDIAEKILGDEFFINKDFESYGKSGFTKVLFFNNVRNFSLVTPEINNKTDEDNNDFHKVNDAVKFLHEFDVSNIKLFNKTGKSSVYTTYVANLPIVNQSIEIDNESFDIAFKNYGFEAYEVDKAENLLSLYEIIKNFDSLRKIVVVENISYGYYLSEKEEKLIPAVMFESNKFKYYFSATTGELIEQGAL